MSGALGTYNGLTAACDLERAIYATRRFLGIDSDVSAFKNGGDGAAPGSFVIPPQIREALREIGPRIDAQRTAALYVPLHGRAPYADVRVTRDVVYGWHERHVLDLFEPTMATRGGAKNAVLVFVHGGGFTMGAKHTAGSPFYDNVGGWAASQGMVGITINYRLAPNAQWPSGIEDLTALLAWLRPHIADYGGHSQRVFLCGHSAGAAHVADYLARAVKLEADPGVAGAILISGFYDLGDEASIWKVYYGDQVSQYGDRSSLPGLLQTQIPLLVADAELDPDFFRRQSDELRRARAALGRPVLSVHLEGHSHISETYAIGSGDESLCGPVFEFVRSNGG